VTSTLISPCLHHNYILSNTNLQIHPHTNSPKILHRLSFSCQLHYCRPYNPASPPTHYNSPIPIVIRHEKMPLPGEIAPKSQNGAPTKQSAPRQITVRPVCTHVSMDMVYSASICNLCGKLPSMGWLYECQQDQCQEYLVNDLKKPNVEDIIETFHVREMKLLGFSRSVISQAERGMYTDDQIEILKRQKIGAKEVIAKRIHLQFPDLKEAHDNETELNPNITIRKKKNGTTKKQEDTQNRHSEPLTNARCHLKCCHASITAHIF
jgi:hypothetical protein